MRFFKSLSSVLARLLLFFLTSSVAAYASLPTVTTWEVRPSVGAATNGGCFVTGASGTDFSQQNAAQYTFTDLVIGATTTNVISVSHSFVAADVGNCMQISAGTGFTKGIYEIVSVAAGVATLDRSAGVAASSGGTYAVGGALDSTTSILTRLGLNSASQGTSGNTIYLKATGNLVYTATQANFDVTNFMLIGYTTTRGDGGQATITTATNSVILFQVNNTGQQWMFQNIIFTSTATTRLAAVDDNANTTDYLYFYNCTFNGVLSAVHTTAQAHNVVFINSIIENCTSSTAAINLTAIALHVYGTKIHDNTGDGVRINGTSNAGVSGLAWFVSSVIKSNGGRGISNIGDLQGNGAVGLFVDNCAVINNVGDGINSQGTGTNFGQLVGVSNTIIDSNGGFGVNVAPPGNLASGTFAMNYGFSNFYRANTSGARNNFSVLPGDITGTADPFTNRAAGDFSLNTTAGGGAACRNAGWPGSPQWIGATAGSNSTGPLIPQAGSGGLTLTGFACKLVAGH